MKLNLKMPDYYQGLNRNEIIECLVLGIAVCALFGYFFYKSLIWGLILIPLGLAASVKRAKELRKRKKYMLLVQFKEMVCSVNASMQAGYSMENSFKEAAKDMSALYGNDARIVEELGKINRGISNNATMSELLLSFANRTEIEEIENFSEVIAVGKSSGGNITEIMSAYVNMIDEKMEVIQEIETMTSARRYEQKILNAIPFVILAYMGLTSGGFLNILYHNVFGNIVMSINLGLYIVAINMAGKITDINV